MLKEKETVWYLSKTKLLAKNGPPLKLIFGEYKEVDRLHHVEKDPKHGNMEF